MMEIFIKQFYIFWFWANKNYAFTYLKLFCDLYKLNRSSVLFIVHFTNIMILCIATFLLIIKKVNKK